MRRVILESPYNAKTAAQAERNLRYARAAMRDALQHGESPLASHLLYTQPGILSDSDPVERQLGIEAGLAWGSAAAATVVYMDLGVSPGMQIGIDHARAEGRPLEYRNLVGWLQKGSPSEPTV